MVQEQINKQIFGRLEKLENEVFKSKTKNSQPEAEFSKIDFDMSKRAFIKKYGKRLSGPKKFVLMLSCLVKGKVGGEISMEEIKKHWDKMTSLFGGKFNTYYSTTAKDNNWADSKKHGTWFLTKDWQNIFS